jgi:hydrogenase-4 component F
MVEIRFIAPFFAGDRCLFLAAKAGRPLLVLTGRPTWLGHNAMGPATGGLLSELFRRHPEGLLSLLVISLLFFLIPSTPPPI